MAEKPGKAGEGLAVKSFEGQVQEVMAGKAQALVSFRPGFIHLFFQEIIYYLPSNYDIMANLADEEVGENEHEIKSGKETNKMDKGSNKKPNTITIEESSCEICETS